MPRAESQSAMESAVLCTVTDRPHPRHVRDLLRKSTKGHYIKTKLAVSCVLFGALLGSAAAVAGDDTAAVGNSASVFVKDSAITTKIKTKLAADHRAKRAVCKEGLVLLYFTGSAPALR